MQFNDRYRTLNERSKFEEKEWLRRKIKSNLKKLSNDF